MKNIFLKISVLFLVVFSLSFFRVGAQVAGPQAFITWKAKGYAPVNYPGKILPGSNSPILASVDVINGGKPSNLSALTIYWYLNDKLIDRGAGLQSTTFRTPTSLGGGIVSLRVQIPDYPGGEVSQSVDIPMVSPSIVLYSGLPQNKFSSQSIVVSALPYFFTVPDISFLTFSWTVNGQDVQAVENPQSLNININQGAASGSALDVKASVTNPAGYFETASNEQSFIFSL